MSAALDRLQQGDAAIYSPTAAAELLPWNDTRSRWWLKRHHLIRHDPDLGAFVLWDEVRVKLRLVSAPPETPETESPTPKRRRPRRGGL